MSTSATPEQARQDLLQATLAKTLEMLAGEPEFGDELIKGLTELASKRQFSHVTRIYQLLQKEG
jgi:hypothetical protein